MGSLDNAYFNGTVNSAVKSRGSIAGLATINKITNVRCDDNLLDMIGQCKDYIKETDLLSSASITSGKVKIHKANGTYVTITVDATKDFNTFFYQLRPYFGYGPSINKGVLCIEGPGDVYLESVSGGSNILSKLGTLNKKTGTVYTNTTTAGINATITNTLTNTTTNTVTITATTTTTSTQTLPVTTSTVLKNINGFSVGNGELKVNGSTVTISETSTIQDLFNKVKPLGITGSVSNGKLKFTSNREMSIESIAGGTNILTVTNMSGVNNITKVETTFTPSNKLTYTPDPDKPAPAGAPESIIFQVGINAEESSQISVSTAFEMPDTEMLRYIGLDNDMDYLALLDSMLMTVNAKQTEFGAAQNRLISALDEIETHYENLTSSRSTLRDADIAEVSSQYIKEQILQQASVTLMSTANQTPALALQLL